MARRRGPADLAAHACLIYAYAPSSNVWRFRDAAGLEESVRISGPAHANNGQMLTSLATAGMGIALEPDFIVAPDVQSGAHSCRCSQALRHRPRRSMRSYPSRRHLSAKVRAFVDFLAAPISANWPRIVVAR